MNKRLYGNSCYLFGQIDRVSDEEAKDWRRDITLFLNDELKVIVFDPCHKCLLEDIKNEREIFTSLSQQKRWQDFKDFGRQIRRIDLRSVDKSDFLIGKIDMDVFACGSIEEATWANQQRKPVLIWCPQGIQKLAGWFKLMLPMDLLFEKIDDIKNYLRYINSSEKIDDLGRWRFFDYKKLYSQIVEKTI